MDFLQWLMWHTELQQCVEQNGTIRSQSGQHFSYAEIFVAKTLRIHLCWSFAGPDFGMSKKSGKKFRVVCV